MADHSSKGSMDIRAHHETFGAFWALTKWGTIATVALLVLMAVFLV